MIKDFKELIVDQMEKNPIEMGIIFILIGVVMLIYKLEKKQSWNSDRHTALSWKSFVNGWALLVMSFIFGMILIIKNI